MEENKDVIQEAILGILSASNRVMIEEDKHSTCRFLDYFVESLTKLHETHGKAINALVSGEGVVVDRPEIEETFKPPFQWEWGLVKFNQNLTVLA